MHLMNAAASASALEDVVEIVYVGVDVGHAYVEMMIAPADTWGPNAPLNRIEFAFA
jgi:hypothetical protein